MSSVKKLRLMRRGAVRVAEERWHIQGQRCRHNGDLGCFASQPSLMHPECIRYYCRDHQQRFLMQPRTFIHVLDEDGACLAVGWYEDLVEDSLTMLDEILEEVIEGD